MNSPSPETVALSILELAWHVHFFDAMGLDGSNKLAVAIGGTFGDKTAALDRFASVIRGLPESWRARLAIEPDGGRFDLADALEASSRTGLPVLLAARSGGDPASPGPSSGRALVRCFDTWQSSDGPPLVHLEATHLDPSDLIEFEAVAPLGVAFDCILESEEGDQAVDRLREALGDRCRSACSGQAGRR